MSTPRIFAGFSALQRAENSSIVTGSVTGLVTERVSVLFSEPKIPQSVVDCDRSVPLVL